MNFSLVSVLIFPLDIENKIEETGATSLSDALKTNKTITKLNLWSEHKMKQHIKGYPSLINFSINIKQ